MANSLSQTMQTSKIELLEWLANEQDESFVQEVLAIIKRHISERKMKDENSLVLNTIKSKPTKN